MTKPDDSNGAPDSKRSVLLLAPRDSAQAFAPKPKSGNPTDNKSRKFGAWFLCFGVILPLLTVVFELTTRYCAQNYFDPFPSTFHVALFCLIPLSNFLLWLSSRRDLSHYYGPMSLLSGMAMGIGCLYTLMFLPITPGSALYVLTFGFGLLGLAPLLSLPASWMAGKSVCQLAHNKKTYFDAHQVEHIGHMIVLVMVIAVELPSTLTRVNISQVISGNAVQRQSSIDWLRHYGNQEVMQRACLERSGKATDIIGTLYEGVHPIPVDKARAVFYKVTGKAYNSVPIPASFRSTIKHNGTMPDSDPLNSGVSDEFDLDADVAGSTVSGMARGLSQTGSKFIAKVDGDAAIASIKWTLSFKNSSRYDREVRTKIQLPPGAVISRATLKIGDVERVATIKAREEARALYQAAVVERKNPLLVSYTGKDQVLVQCFPVEPGADVKLTLTIAIPMYIDKNNYASCSLPFLAERNFVVTKEGAPECDFTAAEMQRNYNNEIAESGHGYLRVERHSKATQVLARAKNLNNQQIVRQIDKPKYDSVKGLFVIVDGSIDMQPHLQEIADGLVGSEPIVDQSAPVKFVSDKSLTLQNTDMLPYQKAVGGQDNSDVLSEAVNICAQKNAKSPQNNWAVLWIHGAQPVATANNNIKQILSNSPTPVLYDMQVADGPNEVLDGLTVAPGLTTIIRIGSIKEDLGHFIDTIQNPKASRAGAEPPDMLLSATENLQAKVQTKVPEVYEHVTDGEIERAIANIWCADQINKILAGRHFQLNNLDAELANQFQIVTPISSAIVYCPDDYRPVKIDIPLKDSLRQSLRLWQEQLLAPFTPFTSAFTNAAQKAQVSLVSQLNNLSCAAGTAGYDGTDSAPPLKSADRPIAIVPTQTEEAYKDKETLQSQNAAPTSDAFGGSAGNYQTPEQKQELPSLTARRSLDPGAAATVSPSTAPMNMPAQSYGAPGPAPAQPDNSQMYAKLNSDEGLTDTKKSDASWSNAKINLKNGRLQGDKDYLDNNRPVLQGATNGTIMPSNGLVGAPVDARYGQSNEVGQTADYGYQNQSSSAPINWDKEMGPLTLGEFSFLALLTAILAALYGITQWLKRATDKALKTTGQNASETETETESETSP